MRTNNPRFRKNAHSGSFRGGLSGSVPTLRVSTQLLEATANCIGFVCNLSYGVRCGLELCAASTTQIRNASPRSGGIDWLLGWTGSRCSRRIPILLHPYKMVDVSLTQSQTVFPFAPGTSTRIRITRTAYQEHQGPM